MQRYTFLLNCIFNQLIQTENYEIFSQMFNEFKNKVLNLFSATNKYNENLLIEIENNYMNSIDENLLNENLN